MTRYILDSEVDSIILERHSDKDYVARFSATSPELDLLNGFLGHLRWEDLDFFAMCIARGAGCGFDVTSTHYDNELEPNEEPFAGVKIYDDFEEDVVLSRQAYERFCLRVLDFAETVAKAEDQPILTQPVWSKIIADRECLRARLEVN